MNSNTRKKSRTEYSVINMLTGIAGYAINTIVGLACRIVFVRVLSVDYLGVSGLFSNVLSMLSLAELGISSAIIYALYKPIADNDTDKISAIMKLYKKAYEVIGIVVAGVGLSLLPFFNVIIREQPTIKENIYILYLLYLLNTVISYFFSYRASLLTAMQRQYIVSGYNYVVTIIQSILQILFLLVTHEYITYLLIQIAGGIIYNIWVSHKAAIDYPYILNRDVEPLSKNEKKSLLVNIKALALSKISGIMVNSTDNVAITFFKGISAVGFASNYTVISGMVGGIIGLLLNALPGSVGNLNATSTKEESYHFFNVLSLLNFWLFGWGGIGIALVSTELVKLLYGYAYAMPFYIPLIIAINSYTIGMLNASYIYKSTMGLFKYGQYLLFLTGFINLFLDVLLGRLLGTLGIYLATLIARACTNLWYEPYAVFKYGFNKKPILYWKRYIKYLFILCVAGGLSFVGCYFCDFSIWINCILKIVICSIVFNVIFIAAFYRTKEFAYIKNIIWRIIKRISN